MSSSSTEAQPGTPTQPGSTRPNRSQARSSTRASRRSRFDLAAGPRGGDDERVAVGGDPHRGRHGLAGRPERRQGDEVLSDATRRVSSAQAERFAALEASPDGVPVRAWLEAWAVPFVAVVTSTSPDERRLGRIVGQTLSEETGLAAKVRQLTASADERLIRGLACALSPIDERELWLRLTVMASALAGLASGTFDPLLARATTERSLDDRLLDLLEAIARTPVGPTR
jgi:hypothetical protein